MIATACRKEALASLRAQTARRITAVLAAVLVVGGCAAPGGQEQGLSKQTLGTVIGSVGGALIGSRIGGGSGRTAAVIAGALAGGALGNWIGGNLDERDRQALAARTQQALDSGAPMTWQSEHSGASATITPGESKTVTRETTVRRSPKVVAVAGMRVIDEPYQASKSANLRAAPTTDAGKVGGLAVGQTFTAVGRTENNWIAVGRKGTTVGYVHGSLVGPATPAASDTATDLDSISVAAAQEQGFDLDAFEPAAPVSETVAVRTTCRTVSYEVKTASGQEQKTVDACRSADGAWQLG